MKGFFGLTYEKLLHFIFQRVKTDGIYFIGTNEFLPPPLSKEEEQELLGRIKSGNAAERIPRDVRSTLIERNLRLVVFIARKFDNTGVCIDDLISIGSIGLIKAVDTFDPVKNIKLATYAARCIENEILMYLRRSCRYKLEVSLDEPLNVDWDGNELLLCDVLGTDGDLVTRELEEQSDIELLKKAIQKLKPREKQIIELRYGISPQSKAQKELTQKEVADLMGISQSYISRLEKRILDILKREISV